MRLLLIEDDNILGDGIRSGLQDAGYSVDWLTTAEEGLRALETQSYSVVILDIRLPGMSGLELLKQIRKKDNPIPVLLLTAYDTTRDKVMGLDSGADDYLVKPFDFDELLARLRSIVRRQHGRASPTIRHGNIVINPAAHTVTIDDKPVDLGRRAFALLLILLENKGNVMSRQSLEESLYAWGEDVGSNAVEVHIHHLRKKCGSEFIRTIRGVGYTIDKETS